MMAMVACTGKRRGRKRWGNILFLPCFEIPHSYKLCTGQHSTSFIISYVARFSGQVEPACLCADVSVEQSRADQRREGWQERGLQHLQLQQVCHFSDEEMNEINKNLD